MMTNLHLAAFSPAGSTRTVIDRLAARFKDQTVVSNHNLLHPVAEPPVCGAGELLIVGVPVFAGRVPIPAAERLRQFKGQRIPAIAFVTYGNRDYEDALRELIDLLQENGFWVIGAAAFIARHSIFPVVASDRPDDKDMALIDSFADTCQTRLADFHAGKIKPLAITSTEPYKPHALIPFKPIVEEEYCQGCGMCAVVCPVEAIDPLTPMQTDITRCITCTACVYVCPHQARSFHTDMFETAQRAFAEKFSTRQEPKIVIVEQIR